MFLPLADPMPVGTRLELHNERETALVRVVKVIESADAAQAGVNVRPAGIAEHVEPIFEPEPAPAPPPAVVVAPAPVASPPGQAHGEVVSNARAPHAGAADQGAVPTVIVGEVSEPIEAGEAELAESQDTASTSEYPALSNGAGNKRRTRKRKR